MTPSARARKLIRVTGMMYDAGCGWCERNLLFRAEFAGLLECAAERSVGGMADMNIGGDSPRAGVPGSDGFSESVGMVGLNQVHRASRPSRPGELGSQESRSGGRGLDKGVQGVGAVFEVVAARGMRGRNQAAKLDEISRSECVGPAPNSLVFREHMASPLAADWVKMIPVLVELIRGSRRAAGNGG